MKRRALVAGLLAIAVFAARDWAAAQEPLAVYEDWSSNGIRPDRWRGGLPFAGHDSGLGSRRFVTLASRLVMQVDQATPPSGEGRAGMNRLEFANPAAVTALEAQLIVQRAKVQAGCPTGPELDIRPSEAEAGIVLSPFNDGSSSGPGDRIGDYLAVVTARNSTEAGRSVFAFWERCDDADCTMFSEPRGSRVVLGSFTAGSELRIRVAWDPAHDQFLVGLNAEADAPLPYVADDSHAAAGLLSGIWVRAGSADCQEGTNTGSIRARFRRILTNASAVVP